MFKYTAQIYRKKVGEVIPYLHFSGFYLTFLPPAIIELRTISYVNKGEQVKMMFLLIMTALCIPTASAGSMSDAPAESPNPASVIGTLAQMVEPDSEVTDLTSLSARVHEVAPQNKALAKYAREKVAQNSSLPERVLLGTPQPDGNRPPHPIGIQYVNGKR